MSKALMTKPTKTTAVVPGPSATVVLFPFGNTNLVAGLVRGRCPGLQARLADEGLTSFNFRGAIAFFGTKARPTRELVKV